MSRTQWADVGFLALLSAMVVGMIVTGSGSWTSYWRSFGVWVGGLFGYAMCFFMRGTAAKP